MSTEVSVLAEQNVRAYNFKNPPPKNLSGDEPVTFKKLGLIPNKSYFWDIPQWMTRGTQGAFLTSEHIRSVKEGGIFDEVELAFMSRGIIKQNCPGTPKRLMAYILDRDMTEGELLKSASDLQIRRFQSDDSGRQVFSVLANQTLHQFSKIHLEKEVDAHDFYRIAHAHAVSGTRKLPLNINFHFFPDIMKIDEESGKMTLIATHASLRNSPTGLKASASRFSPRHIWKKGDMCVFAPHEGMNSKL